MKREAFFGRDIHDVARDLLGRQLLRVVGGHPCRAKIVEVEVYEGENDAASHARSGTPTPRTEPMFAAVGTLYVYTIYGMYQCLNLRAPSVTGPGAILIRACEPLAGRAQMAMGRGLVDTAGAYEDSMAPKLMSGPAKLCQALGIQTELSGQMIGDALKLKAGEAIWRDDPSRVEATQRVGLNPKTCGPSVKWPWRYLIADSRWTSCRAG